MVSTSPKPLGRIGNGHVRRTRDNNGKDKYICEYCHRPFVPQPGRQPRPEVVAQHLQDMHSVKEGS